MIGAVAAVAGLLGLLAVALSERVMPGLVSGRFAFLTGVGGMTAVAAGAFVIWVRLAAGPRPVDTAVPAEADPTTPSGVGRPHARRPEVTTPSDSSAAGRRRIPPVRPACPAAGPEPAARPVRPRPASSVGTYPDYALAQQAVDHLSDNKFPVSGPPSSAPTCAWSRTSWAG